MINHRAVLTVIEGPLTGEHFALSSEKMTLGLSGELKLKGRGIAPLHASIYSDNNRYHLRRLSTNLPLLVNDQAIDEYILAPLDEIVIGDTTMIFTLAEGVQGGISTLADDTLDGPRESVKPQLPSDGASPKTGGLDYRTRKMDVQPKGQPDLNYSSFDKKAVEIHLAVTAGVAMGQEHVFQEPTVVIGRSIGDLVIADPDISRKHCSIEVQTRERVFIHDHASTNGTFVNGNEVSYSLLKSGDIISIGKTRIVVRLRAVSQR